MTLLSSYQSIFPEAGCDEAGRGCLAGPVVAAAVIFPPGYQHPKINDSKKLSEKLRNQLRREIEVNALSYAVAYVDNEEIDRINIVKASVLAMHKALDQLTLIPRFILVDGNYFLPYKDIAHKCHVKGDGKYLSIAAASILAKTYRDEYMRLLHPEYSHYGWDKNKGYPTLEHRQAVDKYGLTQLHRKTFCKSLNQLSFDF